MAMQNEMPMTIGGLELKSEVEFHDGSRSFSETGSSYNSAVDIFTKFSTLSDPDILRTCAPPNRNRKLIRDVTKCGLSDSHEIE